MIQQQTYTVGISKVYFPKEYWPKLSIKDGTDIVLLVKIKAVSRVEAAKKAWDTKYASAVIPLLASYVKRVSLYVNDPKYFFIKLSPLNRNDISNRNKLNGVIESVNLI